MSGASWSGSACSTILTEVKEMILPDEKERGKELLQRVKIYNYIPASAEEKYRIALLQEYQKCKDGGTI
jgi:ribosomal protein L13